MSTPTYIPLIGLTVVVTTEQPDSSFEAVVDAEDATQLTVRKADGTAAIVGRTVRVVDTGEYARRARTVARHTLWDHRDAMAEALAKGAAAAEPDSQ